MEELSNLYKAISELTSQGYDPKYVKEKLDTEEEQYFIKEILPILRDQLMPKLKAFKRDVSFRVNVNGGKSVGVSFSHRCDFGTMVLNDGFVYFGKFDEAPVLFDQIDDELKNSVVAESVNTSGDLMTIWNAFCSLPIRNWYKKVLQARGMPITQTDDIMEKFNVYLSRIKNSPVVVELRNCESLQECLAIFDDIFENKWKNNMQENYRDMPYYFRDYALFLRSAKSIFDNLNIRMDENMPLLDDNEVSSHSLSDYELPYLQDGKLQMVLNPELLRLIKPYLSFRKQDMAKAVLIAKLFYGDNLPSMTAHDWENAVDTIWQRTLKSKTGRLVNALALTGPDGVETVMNGLQALQTVVEAIGLDNVFSYKLNLKNELLLVKYVMPLKEKYYKEISPGWYLNNLGGAKEKATMIRILANHFNVNFKVQVK